MSLRKTLDLQFQRSIVKPAHSIVVRRFSVLVFALFISLCVFASDEPKRAYPEVGPGIVYLHERDGSVPWSWHVVKIDRARSDLTFITSLAQNTIYGLSPVSVQVSALPADFGKPVAAVNGDFFWIRPGPYQGDPTGIQIIQGEMVSAPTGVSFWIDSSGAPHAGTVTSQLKVTWPDGTESALGLNQERKDDAAVLYTPTLGVSTRTFGGREFVVEPVDSNRWLPLRGGQTYKGKVREIRDKGDTLLQPNDMVLSLGPQAAKRLPAVKTGAVLQFTTATVPDLGGVTTALGGGPVLVKEGRAQAWSPSQPRHPRTAIGWKDSHFFFFVVDGRQKDLSLGMTFPELAAEMLKLGCTEAMNLDGGGSSTLWLGGQVMNSPSDGQERAVANALILVRKEK